MYVFYFRSISMTYIHLITIVSRSMLKRALLIVEHEKEMNNDNK